MIRHGQARLIGFRKGVGDPSLSDHTVRVPDDRLSSPSHNSWWFGYHDEKVQDWIQTVQKVRD